MVAPKFESGGVCQCKKNFVFTFHRILGDISVHVFRVRLDRQVCQKFEFNKLTFCPTGVYLCDCCYRHSNMRYCSCNFSMIKQKNALLDRQRFLK